MPNIAIIEELRGRYKADDRLDLLYIGTRKGMEKGLMARLNVPYKGIFCGKLRRYFSFRNLLDFFQVPVGILQAFLAIRKFKPDLVFCKGGYVSFPVAIAAWIARKKVILHESDLIPGLANKLSARFASRILTGFQESNKFFDKNKVEWTGNPVRKWLIHGDKKRAQLLTGLKEEGLKEGSPVILIWGGSQGADFINKMVYSNLGRLLKDYQIIHICGKGNLKPKEEIKKYLQPADVQLLERYFNTEFAAEELKDLYAITDLFISRAGANSLAEIEYLGKPALLIPLGTRASRGDQIENARTFAENYPAEIMYEDNYNPDLFFGLLQNLLKHRDDKIPRAHKANATDKIVEIIMNSV